MKITHLCEKLYSMLVPTSCLNLPVSRGGRPAAPASSLYAVDRDAPTGYVDLLSYMEPSIFSHVNTVAAPGVPIGAGGGAAATALAASGAQHQQL